MKDATLERQEPHGGAGTEDSNSGAGDAVGEPVMAAGNAEDGDSCGDRIGSEAKPVAIVDSAALGTGKGSGGMAGGEGMVVGEVRAPTAGNALEGLGDGFENDKRRGGGNKTVGGVVASVEARERESEGSNQREKLEIVGSAPLPGGTEGAGNGAVNLTAEPSAGSSDRADSDNGSGSDELSRAERGFRNGVSIRNKSGVDRRRNRRGRLH